MKALDQPCRGRRFSGAGGTEQDYVALPRSDPACQILDRGRLITGGLELTHDLEATAFTNDLVHGAVLRVREYGVFGRESHTPQPRTCVGHILVSIHPPKHETFDLAANTNTDPKGIVRAVDVYTVRPWGLYMARPTPGREQFHYIESWLLPSLGLRVTVFHFNPGHERDQDYYLDVGEYQPGPTSWQGTDYYLDLVLRTGAGVQITDVGELCSAVALGLLSPERGERAIHTAIATVEALTRHDYDLHHWLESIGMALAWRGT